MSKSKTRTKGAPPRARTPALAGERADSKASGRSEAGEDWKGGGWDGEAAVPEEGDGARGPGMTSRGEEPSSAIASREAFRQVGREVLSSALDPEAWAQALAQCRGTHDDALALYSRIRCRNLSRFRLEQQAKAGELETRRRGSFRDFRSVPMARGPRVPPHARGLRGFLDSVFWHLLAAAGTAGCLLAARILWPGLFANVPDLILAVAVVAMQLIPLAGWWAGSGPRGAVTYPGIAQLAACVALTGSLVLGVKLLGSGDRHTADRSPPPAVPRQSPLRPVPDAAPEAAGPARLVSR